MNFKLTTLGTASAMPVVGRNQSAHVLQVHGRLFLIDCGENAQQSIRAAGLSFVRIEAIFISHIHGDHVFGLFGLLSTLGMYGRSGELHIFGPSALNNMLRFYKSWYGDELGFEIVFHEVSVSSLSEIYLSSHVRVSAFPLHHKIETYGYRFDEIPSAKHPEAAHLCSYAYASDTAPFPELADYVRGVDLLYHEATYTDELAEKAVLHHHSTSGDAARCAADAGVGTLVVGHYSSRCRNLQQFLDECRSIFPETFAASDGDNFEIPYHNSK